MCDTGLDPRPKTNKKFALKNIIDLAKYTIPGNGNQKVKSLVMGRKMSVKGMTVESYTKGINSS